MDLGVQVSHSRCVVVWGAVTAGALGLLAGVRPVLVAGPGAGFDPVLVWGCALVAAATTCWLWAVATVVTADAVRGHPTLRRGVPSGVRRAVLVLCGAAVAGGLAAPALAGGERPAGPHVLAGLRLPERVAVVHPAAPHATRHATPGAVPEPGGSVVVVPGDTLWDIAARRLGAAGSWPAIYALNRDVIGPDPGLITPGQRLTLPAEAAGGPR